jgi:hypothetical protein
MFSAVAIGKLVDRRSKNTIADELPNDAEAESDGIHGNVANPESRYHKKTKDGYGRNLVRRSFAK